jgi:hypothetical protein
MSIQRAPGSFSPVVATSTSSRPPIRRVDSSSSEDSTPLTIAKPRTPATPRNAPTPPPLPRPLYASSHANSSTSSLQNFSRPTVAQSRPELSLRNVSPLTGATSNSPITSSPRGHGRKHSSTQGSFEPYLPTAASSNLGRLLPRRRCNIRACTCDSDHKLYRYNLLMVGQMGLEIGKGRGDLRVPRC